MSGGHFGHNQYRISYIADEIENIIKNNNKKDEYGYSYDYPEHVLKEFRTAIKQLKIAHVYSQRIDWLVSGDDGEESFIKRLTEDLKELQ